MICRKTCAVFLCHILTWLAVFCLQCVGDDIEDLEYTPKPEFEGHFKVTNVKNEVMNSCRNNILINVVSFLC